MPPLFLTSLAGREQAITSRAVSVDKEGSPAG